MTAVAKLLPCPFCGSQPKSGWQGASVPGMEDCGYWGIDCCNAFAHAGSEQDAAAQWNRRAALSPAELGGVESKVLCHRLHQPKRINRVDAMAWRLLNNQHLRDVLTRAADAEDQSAVGCLRRLDLILSRAAPQPAQAGASGGGEVEIAEIMRGCLSAIEGGRDPRYGFSIGPSIEGIEEAAKRIAAMLATPASPATGAVAWDNFPSYLIDNCEGEVISEESLQRWLEDMLKNPRYQPSQSAAPQPQEATATFLGFKITEAPGLPDGVVYVTDGKGNPLPPGAFTVPVTPPAHGDGEGDYAAKWFAECRRVLEDVSTEMRATGRGDTRFRRLIESMPRQRTTRPTPEAQEARDADTKRLDYIERTFSGVTNRERYLPVQMIWGKGCNGRTLREACDKYMKRDTALALPAQGEGKNG